MFFVTFDSLQTSTLGRAMSMRGQKPVATISVESSSSIQSATSVEGTPSKISTSKSCYVYHCTVVPKALVIRGHLSQIYTMLY